MRFRIVSQAVLLRLRLQEIQGFRDYSILAGEQLKCRLGTLNPEALKRLNPIDL